MLRHWLVVLAILVTGPIAVALGANTVSSNRYSQEVMQKRNVAIKDYVDANSTWDWNEIQKSGGLIHPNDEFKSSVDFLYQQNPETRPFIKFFTTYDVPHGLRNQTVLTLSFELHSLIAWSDTFQPTFHPLAIQTEDGRFIPHQLVPGSATLWWIDIRDYGWDNEAFEQVTLLSGDFVIPIIDERLAFLLDAEGLSPNILLKASWFVTHAFDNQRQVDRGFTPITDILIYSRLNRAPLNLDELKALWAVDNGVLYTTLVTESETVARHNRVLAATQGRFLGPFFDTHDVLFQEGARDYLEDVFNFVDGVPRVRDAGETFWHNQLGFMVYDLFNGVEARVTFGDPTAVRHFNDVIGDVRVRVSHSCTDCHTTGALQAENTLVDLAEAGIKLRVPEFDDTAELDAGILGHGFDREVEQSREIYARAVKGSNGLTPEQNGTNYLTVVAWYSQRVTLEQAAIEVGVTPDLLRAKLVGKSSGRLAALIVADKPMPRDIWDSVGFDGVPGGFQQAMVLVYGLFFKDLNLKIEEADFLERKQFDWKENSNITQDINKFLGLGNGTVKSNVNETVKPEVVSQRSHEADERLQLQLDQLRKIREQLKGQPEHTAKVVEPELIQIWATIRDGGTLYAWEPNSRESDRPIGFIQGTAKYAVFNNTNRDWLGIIVGNGQRVFVKRNYMSMKGE